MITQEEIMTSVVRALTWKEPFATSMLKGKINETRSRWTGIRGLVVICSGLTCYKERELLDLCGEQFEPLLTALGRDRFQIYKETRGNAIGIGRLWDCWQMRQKDEPAAFVKYDSKKYIHRYAEAYPIVPFPFTGTMGWSILSEFEKSKIKLLNPL